MNATPSSVEMLASLVGFDTTSRRSNLALIDFVRAFLDNHGVSYRLSANEARDKANLHAIIGPQTAGGVALCGHVDTVPVDGQTWATDPFRLHRAGEKLHARGRKPPAPAPAAWSPTWPRAACARIFASSANRAACSRSVPTRESWMCGWRCAGGRATPPCRRAA
jgi:hypothetical protein